MIIKGLFRRYKRWNPVHPTSGAFWGMGIGIGCGVGWGPGFGPEVIGYVGAGCGVGFSVGITLVGFGVGLPANCLLEVPYNAFLATRSGLLDMRNVTLDGWSNIGLQMTGSKGKASGRSASFKHEQCLDKRVDLSNLKSIMSSHSRSVLDCFENLKSIMSSHSRSVLDCFEKFKSRVFHPSKGFRD